jgi:hypothetical protein
MQELQPHEARRDTEGKDSRSLQQRDAMPELRMRGDGKGEMNMELKDDFKQRERNEAIKRFVCAAMSKSRRPKHHSLK